VFGGWLEHYETATLPALVLPALPSLPNTEANGTNAQAERGKEQDVAEISRRMYEEIRSSRDPRDHVEDG